MIASEQFLAALREHGFGLISGVPCSYLTPLINGTINSDQARYVNAANEGEAVAIAAGASLGGVGSVAMFQNSGLGNAVSPLTSLTWTFRIPILLITTWRGQPHGPTDEPQHELMGQITEEQLRLMEIPHEKFPNEPGLIDEALGRAVGHMQQHQRPYAFVMEKGSIQPAQLRAEPASRRNQAEPVQQTANSFIAEPDHVLRTVQSSSRPTDILLATTGFTGRALYACGDRRNQLYMVGSMGCVSSLALGLAIAQPDRRIVVLDGDGAALMRLGALAAVGREQPGNLLHILLDNGVHDSTGSQETLSSVVDFPQVAAACGYPQVTTASSLRSITEVMQANDDSLRFLHVRTAPRADRKLPRPTIPPHEVANRLRDLMETSTCQSPNNVPAC